MSQKKREKTRADGKKCTMSKEKYSFTTCDFVTAYVTFITNNFTSASDWKKQSH